ncbi:hypothetical protein TRICI_005635 [Trichomonascus ciferrii]|uniref:Fatty acid hydroxylase domain-containing protein n=1 Tax=Trichomonascus ciferrii TaxID=44093 RepID=A0A642UXP1_9ASCO|nr:hypothetical protein TRICI_005635 [Trichomonascus ciferrii]
MDIVLECIDTYALDYVYATLLPATEGSGMSGFEEMHNVTLPRQPGNILSKAGGDIYGQPFMFPASSYIEASSWSRDNIYRQFISLFFVTWIFGYVLYFGTAAASYYFLYDPRNFKHPKYLKNQVRLEIMQATRAIPVMTLLTVPWFMAELNGWSNLYMDVGDYGWTYLVLQFPMFLMFTDCGIYLIHRWLHSRAVYKHLHKPHHKWLVPTPFASHAFHPLDGYFQSLPYHMFPFVFPLHKIAYMVLFTFVNVWSVMIHDGEYLANNPVINGSACHTIHHLYFNYNYGQYTTLWDRLGSSHRTPDAELFDKNLKMDETTWKKQVSGLEEIAKDVEDTDDRVYAADEQEKKTK